jgi:aldehyde dehydrogenase
MTNQEQVIAEIAREVVARLRAQMQQPQPASAPAYTPVSAPASAPAPARHASSADAHDGVFHTVDEAVNAAHAAQKKVEEMSLEERGRMISVVRRICIDRSEELGKMELEETKVGRLDHKIQKLKNMRYVLGVEAMHSEARTDSSGLLLIEHAPWGQARLAVRVAALQPRDRARVRRGQRAHHNSGAQH